MLPIHIDTSFTTIYFYEGIYFLISIVIGVYIIYRSMKKYGGNIELFDGLILWSIIGALLGARLSHLLFWNFDLFISNPLILFRISGSGNSITGGLVGGMVGGYLFTKRNKISYFQYFSLVSPGLLAGQAIGRIGCFLNGDAHGIATDSIFGMQFPRYGTTIPSLEKEYGISSPAWQWSYENGLVDKASTMSIPLHPTQLYEMFGDFILLGIVLWIFHKIWESDKKSPLIFFIHTGGYALLRYGLEFIRGDREFVTLANMSNLQIALLTYGLFTVWYAIRYYLKRTSIR